MALAVRRRAGGLDTLGLSGDEAVYLGQARAIREGLLPEVRAHPPLLGLVLRLVPDGTVGEAVPRGTSVVIGIVAVVVAGLLARELAGRAAGAVAAFAVATMPYHADVTRLVLVEVPMASTMGVALLLAVRSLREGRTRLFEGAAATLGVATLFKETAVLSGVALAVAVLVGALRVPRSVAVRACGWYALVVSAYPAYLLATGGLRAAEEYLRWQVSRAVPAGPGYAEVVLPRIGWGVLAAAGIGAVLALARHQPAGITVLLSVVVPAAFYVVWPISSYPYLLVLIVPLAALAGAGVAALGTAMRTGREPTRTSVIVVGAGAVVVLGATPATGEAPELPGASGVPAVREAATWLSSQSDGPIVTAAPWVANVVRTYAPGRSVASVRPSVTDVGRLNPAERGRTVANLPPDAVVVVWDAWTASRDVEATARLLDAVRLRGGRVGHVEGRSPPRAARLLVVVYHVPPARVGGRA
ncbi:glycosyltransferase family 39 protein [Oryzobacter terrae]|uniref:glycosyltransferase family 39 protein n=1 Tax=Oryzobacter terrae TaxID=1620385 RepID=UPI00366C49F0